MLYCTSSAIARLTIFKPKDVNEKVKIVHCCLANYFVDGYGYQENILTRIHKEMGLDVTVVASTETVIDNKKVGYVDSSIYETEHGIRVIRLPYTNFLPHFLSRKLRVYKELFAVLDSEKPDILFVHDCNFLGVLKIAKYMKKYPDTRLYVDSHTDYVNSGRSWISMNILHKIIYRYCAQVIVPHTRMFYGTLPQRVDFYRDVYNVPAEKLSLLEMGADDKYIDFSKKPSIRNSMREKYAIDKDAFTLITGGKIEPGKNLFSIIEAFKLLRKEFDGIKDIRLIIFGTPDDELRKQFESETKDKGITATGWIQSEDVYDMYFASDLAVFPGTHSVLWEQAIGCGLPCVFRRWDGIEHVDIGGNCILLEDCNSGSLVTCLRKLISDSSAFNQLKQNSEILGPKHFSYKTIAKRAIEYSDEKLI